MNIIFIAKISDFYGLNPDEIISALKIEDYEDNPIKISAARTVLSLNDEQIKKVMTFIKKEVDK